MNPQLVMEAAPWTITNKETGEVEREGFTLTYFDLESPHVGKRRGFEPLRITATKELVEATMTRVPGFYYLHFRQRANRETGKVELALSAARYAGHVEVPHGEP